MEEYVRQFENHLMMGNYEEIYEKQQEAQETVGYSIEELYDISFEKSLSLEIKDLIEVITSFKNLMRISVEYNRTILEESFSEMSEVEKRIMPENVCLDFQIDSEQTDMFIAA